MQSGVKVGKTFTVDLKFSGTNLAFKWIQFGTSLLEDLLIKLAQFYSKSKS